MLLKQERQLSLSKAKHKQHEPSNEQLQLPVQRTSRPSNSAYLPATNVASSKKNDSNRTNKKAQSKPRTIQQKDQCIAGSMAEKAAAVRGSKFMQHHQISVDIQEDGVTYHHSAEQFNYEANSTQQSKTQSHAGTQLGSSQCKRRSIKSSLQESIDRESEYNMAACSSDSTPEHKIHTVVVSQQPKQKLPQYSTARGTQIQTDLDDELNDSNCSDDEVYIIEGGATSYSSSSAPQTPCTNTLFTSESKQKMSPDAVAAEDCSSFDISQFTNGNMSDFVEDQKDGAAGSDPKKDKAEFMYDFDGAMSVIQETDEPDDEMTIKNSQMSSRIQTTRIESLATPYEQLASKEPIPYNLNRLQVPSPQGNAAHATQTPNVHHLQLVAQTPSAKRPTSASLQEDSHQLTAGMESLEEPKPIMPLVVSNQNAAAEPKSMQNCVQNASSMLRLLDLTQNNLPDTITSPICATAENYMMTTPTPKQKSTKCSAARPPKSASGSASQSQLKSYLQRQQELILGRQAPVQTGQSPHRKQQQKTNSNRWSQKTSRNNTGSGRKEDESSQVFTSEQPSEQNILIFDENLSEQMEPLIESQKVVMTPRVHPGSPLTEMINQVLSPSAVGQQQVGIHEQRLAGLNRSIGNLKDDIKNLSVQIYKEVKAQNQRVMQTGNLFEDKLDCDFLERIMHVYAFFTSCLNLVGRNDKEAHKLLILQPMIEKHITELKLDQLNIQTGATDFFGTKDQTLSSIGGQSFDDISYASISNTMLHQMSNPVGKQTLQHQQHQFQRYNSMENLAVNKSTAQLSAPKKLAHLQKLLQIADQVLQLNNLKHRLILDAHQKTAQPSAQLSRPVAHEKQHPRLDDEAVLQQNPVGPLFTHPSSSTTSDKKYLSGPRRSKETSYVSSPQRSDHRNPSSQQEAEKDIYYYKTEQLKHLKNQSHGSNQAAQGDQIMTPVRRDLHQLKDEDQGSTLESSKGAITSSQTNSPGDAYNITNPQHRRHRSLGHLSSPQRATQVAKLAQATTQTFAYQQQAQAQAAHQGLPRVTGGPLHCADHQEHTVGNGTAHYFSSTMPGSPNGAPTTTNNKLRRRSTNNKYSGYGSNSSQTVDQQQQQQQATSSAACCRTSFLKKKPLSQHSSTERPSMDDTKHTSTKHVGGTYLQNSGSSFVGVMNSSGVSAGAASRDVHEAYHFYQQFSSQQAQNQSATEVLKHQNAVESGSTTLNKKTGSYIALSPLSRENQAINISYTSAASIKDSAGDSFIPVKQQKSQTANGQQQVFRQLFYPGGPLRCAVDEEAAEEHQSQAARSCQALNNELASERIESDDFGQAMMANQQQLQQQAALNSTTASQPLLSPARAQVAQKLPEQKRKLTILSPASKRLKQNGGSARTGEKSMKVLPKGTTTAGCSASGQGLQTIPMLVVSKGSLSPRSTLPLEPLPLHSSSKQKPQPMSRNINQVMSKKSKTNKTQTLVHNASESISDIDMSGYSQATTDQIDQNMKHATRQTKQGKRMQVMAGQGQSSFLATMNMSASVSNIHNDSMLAKQANQSRVEKKANQYNVAADSKVKKALKGVISAQETFISTGSNKQLTGCSSNVNNSQLSSRALKSPGRSTHQTLKRNHSAKLQNLAQVSLQSAGGTQLTSPTKEKRKAAKLSVLNQHSYGGSQRQLAQLTSEQASLLVQPSQSKKKMVVLGSSSRTSNYLLKQEINLNTDKLMGMVLQQPQRHVATSPSKSLSQAFDAVAKAISKKQSQTSSQSSTRVITKRNSYVGYR